MPYEMNRIDVACDLAILLQLTRRLRFAEVDHAGIMRGASRRYVYSELRGCANLKAPHAASLALTAELRLAPLYPYPLMPRDPALIPGVVGCEAS